MTNLVSIADIEQATGLSKDLLRKWRERYGFPRPLPGEGSAAGYDREQVAQLKLIRRLLDAGFRPAQVVGKPAAELDRLYQASLLPTENPDSDKVSRDAIRYLTTHDLAGLNRLLKRERSIRSISGFVRDVVAPLATSLGDAWSRGEVQVYQEHLCTEILTRFLSIGLETSRPKRGYPKIAFATPPKELHRLGLLMAQSVLADHGADCLWLGAQVPVEELDRTARAFQCDVVALSLSFAYSRHRVRPMVNDLRACLPQHVEVWLGGAGAGALQHCPTGVRVFSDLVEPVNVLHERARMRAAR